MKILIVLILVTSVQINYALAMQILLNSTREATHVDLSLNEGELLNYLSLLQLNVRHCLETSEISTAEEAQHLHTYYYMIAMCVEWSKPA